jgi:hypothetical protein
MKKLFILSITIFIASQQVYAQSKDTTGNFLLEALTKTYVLENLPTGFVASPQGDGYTNSKTKATIKIISLPGEYKSAKGQFSNFKPSKSTLFVDSTTHNLNGKEAFTIITEEVSPSKQYENYISIVTLLDFNQTVVMVVSAYPKSQDKILRQQLIKAGLGAKAK